LSKEFGDFPTPPALVADILKCLNVNGESWTRVLEPTCGCGNFISGLLSLPQPPKEIQAIEFNSKYCQEVTKISQKSIATRVIVHEARIFDIDLLQSLKWSESGDLLVIGNPPWVNNTQLGLLDSDNLPVKSNFKRFRGIEALTGCSNFDLTEYILIKIIKELGEQKPTIALLCKTSVARNILQFAYDARLNISNTFIRMIDAKKWFGASVSACLFYLEVGRDKPSYQAKVYVDLYTNQSESIIGIVAGKLVANIQAYQESAFIEGVCPLTWRQGLKHDAASVMELEYIAPGVYQNKLKEIVDIEAEYIYPLLKSTDLFHGKTQPNKAVIVTQQKIGADTFHLQDKAPKLWQYLNNHHDFFSKRKSSIYQGKPPFSIFGIGDYSFSLYKVGISGLHKYPRFRVITPIENYPVMLDDTCYFISCNSLEQSILVAALLNSYICLDFLANRTFLDAKRPITKKILQCINLKAILDFIEPEQLVQEINNELSILGNISHLKMQDQEKWKYLLNLLVNG
jgi:hypothetical protein